MTRILIVAIAIVLSGGARAAVPEFNTEHFCGDFAEKRGGDSMGGIAKAVCVLSERYNKIVVDKAWDHVSAGSKETCSRPRASPMSASRNAWARRGRNKAPSDDFARRRFMTSIKVCYPDAMSGQEIDAIRALLTSKPRPVSWSERRERIDEIGATWPVADDVRLEEVDVDGVPANGRSCRERCRARTDVLPRRRLLLGLDRQPSPHGDRGRARRAHAHAGGAIPACTRASLSGGA